MMRPSRNPLPALVESYFVGYLRGTRVASPHTVRAYRDTLKLFFSFLSRGRSVADLRVEDLNAGHVAQFLSHLEEKRRNGPATRNCGLATLRSFFSHLLRNDPTHASQYHRVLMLPSKRHRPSCANYLEPEEVKAILAQPDRHTVLGSRDHTLLLFLYNTGARIGEALAARYEDFRFVKPRQVRFHGKGGKDRICPLWAETATALQRLCSESPHGAALFRSARGQPLSRDGASYIIRKHVQKASLSMPSLRQQRVTPHVFRHSCAVALLQAGMDVTVIRDYLGHASIATTSRYIATNLKMKRVALEAFWNRAGLAERRSSTFRPKPNLLKFLDSL